MPTTTFDLDDSALTWGGVWANHYLLSASVRIGHAFYPTLDFTFTGTDCSIYLAVTFTGTNWYQVSIDGGAYTVISSPGSANTFTLVPIASGLGRDEPHTVTIKAISSTGSINNCYWKLFGGLSVTGSAPAIAKTATFGNTYGMGNFEALRWVVPLGVHNYNSPQVNYLNSGNAGWRFYANPTSILLYCQGQSTTVDIYRDGSYLGNKTFGSGPQWETVVSGLDGQYHEYEILTTIYTQWWYMQMSLVGGDFHSTILPTPWRKQLLVIGDSISVRVGNTIDSPQGWAGQLARAKGYDLINFGISGWRVMDGTNSNTRTSGACNGFEQITPDWILPLHFRDQLGAVIVELGHNDNSNYTGTTDFQAAYTRMLTKIARAYGHVPIFVLSIPPTSDHASTLASFNAAISATVTAVNALGLTSPSISYLDTSSWIVYASDTVDGIHLNTGGITKFVNQLSAVVPAAGNLSSSGRRRVGVLS